MLVCFILSPSECEAIEIDISTIPQLLDYLQNERLDLYTWLRARKVTYGVIDSTKNLKDQALYLEAIGSDLHGYDVLVVGEPIYGEGLFSSIAGLITSAILSATVAVTGTVGLTAAMVAVTIGYIGAALIMVGISYAIGQVMQMLSPSAEVGGDLSQSQANYLFNGIPNVTEQGGAIPLIFGECFFGGVRIAQKVDTFDIAVSSTPTVDHGIPEIPLANLSSAPLSKWHRLT